MRSRFCQTGGNDDRKERNEWNCLRLGVSAFLLIPVDINKMKDIMKKNFLKVTLVAAVAAMAGYAHQTMKKGLYILLCCLLVVSCSFPEKKGEGQEAVGKVLIKVACTGI